MFVIVTPMCRERREAGGIAAQVCTAAYESGRECCERMGRVWLNGWGYSDVAGVADGLKMAQMFEKIK